MKEEGQKIKDSAPKPKEKQITKLSPPKPTKIETTKEQLKPMEVKSPSTKKGKKQETPSIKLHFDSLI